MNTTALAFALLWRTAVAYLVLAVIVLLALTALRALGLDLVSDQTSASVPFIKTKPTLIYASFSVALLVAEYGLHTNLVRLVWGKRVALSIAGWRRFVVGLAVLLFILAVLNALVATFASTSTWINYKLFGALSLFLVGHLLLADMLKSREKA